jgi:hypothetical protein
VAIEQRVLALVHQRTQNETFGAHADKDHQADGDGQRRPERQPELHEADKGQHREEHHRALREVEHRRGLVDQHETQRDQRVHRSRKQAADQNLEKKPKVRHCLSLVWDAEIGVDDIWSARTSSGVPSPIFLP